MVEGTGLENRQALTRLVGSNPTLTANKFKLSLITKYPSAGPL